MSGRGFAKLKQTDPDRLKKIASQGGKASGMSRKSLRIEDDEIELERKKTRRLIKGLDLKKTPDSYMENELYINAVYVLENRFCI